MKGGISTDRIAALKSNITVREFSLGFSAKVEGKSCFGSCFGSTEEDAKRSMESFLENCSGDIEVVLALED